MVFGKIFAKLLGKAPQFDAELSHYERIVRDYDLTLIELDDEIPRLVPAREAMFAAWRDRDFAAYKAAFNTAHRSGEIVESGRPLYSLVKDWFFRELFDSADEGGSRFAAAIRAFESFYTYAPSAFSAATFADVLRLVGYHVRGTDYITSTPGQSLGDLRSCLQASGALLDTFAREGETDFAWRLADARRAADQGDLAHFKQRFEAAWALDRYNVDLCRAHARMLMPRWLGRDAHDLEVFARQAMDLTKDRFGRGLYALIQQSNTDVGEHELEHTLCEPQLVKEGFDDLMQRFPAPSIVNLYADMLEWMRDEQGLADLLRDRYRVIVPQVWYGDTRADKIEYAFATLAEADEALTARAAA